jgi:hypothetical protein
MAKKQGPKTKNFSSFLKKEGNAFDKIFKEMSESIFMHLIEQHLGIKIKRFRPLKEKMQTTIEREMDFFYEIFTENDEVFILHLEFETKDNSEMIYRVGEYHGMALRRKKMEIRHVVIYLGEKTPKMRTSLEPKQVYKGFDLVNVRALDTQMLLSSQIPDIVLLAILSNYPKEQTEIVLRALVIKIKTLSKSDNELTKYFNQLVMLARLRKIEDLTIKITEEMPISYNIETDYLFQKGIEKGMNQKDFEKNYTFVVNLLSETNFTDAKIASLVGVTVDFVEKIKIELAQKKK